MRTGINYQSNKPKESKKELKNKILLFLKTTFLLLLIIGFIGTGVAVGLVKAALKDVTPVDPSKIPLILSENSVIYDSDGNVLEKIQSGGLRTIVKYEEIDEDLKNAFIATEDRTFFDHHGFNFKRLVGAVIQGLKKGKIQGTSTITQQLARNIYLVESKSERSLTRKIKEAYYAIQIEKALNKKQIFEAYLNTIPLGSGANGVQAAAQKYFSKDAKNLDLVESALISGITQLPTYHSPFTTKKKDDVKDDDYILDDSDVLYTIVYKESCYKRYTDVLHYMKTNGFISESEYEEAKNTDLKTKLKPGKLKNTDISSFFTDLVKDEVIDALMAEFDVTKEEAANMLYTQGLNIYSTLDLNMQTKLENIYVNNENFPKMPSLKDSKGNLKNIIKNNKGQIVLYKQNYIINQDDNLIIPKEDFKYNANGDLILFKNKRLNFNPLYDKKELVGIQVKLKDSYKANEKYQMFIYKGGTIKIPSQYKSFDKNKNLIVNNDFLKSKPDLLKKDSHGNILITKEHYSIGSKGTIQPQSSTVIIDYKTGQIKALIGGRNIKGQRQFNRAVNPRQPGSSIKPIAIYTPALNNGWTAASMIDDVPHYDANGRCWPKNWYQKSNNPKYTGYWGLMTLRHALQWSCNVPPVIISEKIGVTTSVKYLKKMGITSIVESGPRNDMNSAAMALGGMTNGITPLELTAAYGSLGNKGVHIKPYSFTKVTDRNGNIILENKALKTFVINPQVAFLITDIMESGIEEAYIANKAKLKSGMPAAGKTGTTSDKIDAWFIGYTPYYVAGVWIGNDIQTSLPNGSTLSAILWNKIMTEVHKDLPNKEFEKPDGLVRVAIDTKSGKRATELSKEAGHIRNEYFIEGTQPNEYDDVHVKIVICSESEKLATEYCPDTLISEQIFIKRPVPYNPEEHNGFIPKDYTKELPTEYCDIHKDGFNNPIDTIVLPDGTKIFPNGTKLLPDGTIISPLDNTQPNEDTNDSNIIDSYDNSLIDSNND